MGNWAVPSGLAAGAWAARPSRGPAGEGPGRSRARPAVRVAAPARAAARGVRRMAVLLREDGEGECVAREVNGGGPTRRAGGVTHLVRARWDEGRSRSLRCLMEVRTPGLTTNRGPVRIAPSLPPLSRGPGAASPAGATVPSAGGGGAGA